MMINVVDLEATCWEGQDPPGQTSEIIEIGICELSYAGEIGRKKSIVVKPTRSYVSKFCTELTGWTQEEVDKGVSFGDACQMLVEEFDSKARVWLSWGLYDRNMFERSCRTRGVRYPFGRDHVNAKVVYSMLKQQKKFLSMPEALALENLSLDGRHHNGMDDAANIAKIWQQVIKKSK